MDIGQEAAPWPVDPAWLRRRIARLGELVDLVEVVEQDWARRFVMCLVGCEAARLRAVAEQIATVRAPTGGAGCGVR